MNFSMAVRMHWRRASFIAALWRASRWVLWKRWTAWKHFHA